MVDRVQRVLSSPVTYLVVGLVVGAAVAPVAMETVSSPDGTVAVVPIEGTIDGQSVARITAMLQAARQNESVEAVVLVVNSGGGTAAASEELYLQVKRTAKQMPVVAAVDAAAASGAYYGILPSDRIYAKPSSIVGSVGVLAPTPVDAEPNDIIATTGPNKLSGYDDREFKYALERLQEAFLGAVFANRGDALTLSKTKLAEARVWVGAEAVSNGLVDEIGGRQAAVRDAARAAGLDDYRVAVLRPDDATIRFVSRTSYLASNAEHKRMISPWYYVDRGGLPVYLMMPIEYFEKRERSRSGGPGPTNGSVKGTEVSHGSS